MKYTFNQQFDAFLQTKYSTFKRYSGKGTDSLAVMIAAMMTEVSKDDYNYEETVLGMGHRGRLNVLTTVCDYPLEALLAKVEGKRDIPANIEGIDDVVSHISCSNKKVFALDGNMRKKEHSLSMVHNPSHLEASYPVVLGKARAKMDDYKDPSKVFSLIVHGDSALTGQGLVYETLALHKTPNSTVDGTVHIVCNNQIGFTTNYPHSRSTRHSTDIFKSFEIPVVHVSAEDISSVIKMAKLAVKYKEKYKKDFVINLLGYRQFGHNELDEPSFTQPEQYKKIRKRTPIYKILEKQLLEQGLITTKQIEKWKTK